MKIALIQCPSWSAQGPPYTLALLAAILRKDGYLVKCFDLNIEMYGFCKENVRPRDSVINEESWEMDFRGNVWYAEDKVLDFIKKYEFYVNRLVDDILNYNAEVIGFSAQSTSKFFSLKVAEKIKAKDQNKLIIFGGPLCFKNCYGTDLLKHFKFIDYVCFAEAEGNFLNLLDALDKNRPLQYYPGFACRSKDGTVKEGGDVFSLANLEDNPVADYYDFSFEKYTRKLLPISTSRGCINRCTFCSEDPHYWGKYRNRGAQSVFNEIKYQLKRYPHIKSFWFNDSLINGDIKMLDQLCDLLLSKAVKITWGGQAMVRKEMTGDFLQKMRWAGCRLISYGVESGSSRILKLMGKNYTPELAEKVVEQTFKAGIEVIFNIIVGFPGEAEEEFRETKEFVRHYKKYVTYIEMGTFLLLKCSSVYNHLDKYNIAPVDYRDSEWQLKWQTKDSLNTYNLRQRRLEELKRIANQ